MRSTVKYRSVLCVGLALTYVSSASAAVVVTQIQDRCFWSLWLYSDWIQQNLAHEQVMKDHDTSSVEVFDEESLEGVDIVYVSPAIGELQLATAEIDALETFVIGGGRLILPVDNGSKWVEEYVELAARFGVIYGDGYINGTIEGIVQDFDNPITEGPAGTVHRFTGAAVNDNLTSTNEDFRVLALWDDGPVALGFLELGAGQVVFLSDFNTWDNDMIFNDDNQTLWTNLFLYSHPGCEGDVNGDGLVDPLDSGFVLARFGCPVGTGDPSCDAADTNADGLVDPLDVGFVLARFGDCP